MKKCPFCAEEIQDEAVKCKHCSEFLTSEAKLLRQNRPWYFRDQTVIILAACLPPLAFPSIWFNKYYSWKTRTVLTIVVAALTYGVWVSLVQLQTAMDMIMRQM
jgi:hypothetical protein